MADEPDPKSEASAEKAYAAAAEAVPLKIDAAEAPSADISPADPAPAEPAAEAVEFPAKAKRTTKAPAAAAKPAAPKARKAPAKAKPVKRAVAKPAPAKAKAAPKPVKAKAPAPVKTSTAPKLKEKPMDKTADFVADAQAKAKQAFEKSTAMFGDYAEFAKGNVEALVESGKILATGIQDMGSSLVTESKSAFETTTADVKQLAGAKSPSEFFKLQTDILRRNFDSAVALTSKNGEAVMKLASDSFAPISGRVSLAVEKLKQAA